MNSRSFYLFLLAVLPALLLGMLPSASAEDDFRPPAVPLVACDPYFSIWSQSDNLWESDTTHWTGKPHRLAAILRVDGQAYRLMGASPQTIAALKQTSVKVWPTRTVYEFEGHGLSVELTFTTPALPDDLDILSRPTTYVTCKVSSNDAPIHDATFYFDAGGEIAANLPDQHVVGAKEAVNDSSHIVTLKLGTESQQVLGKAGDDLRIDWGYLYLASNQGAQAQAVFGNANSLREAFASQGARALADLQVQFPVAAGEVVAAIAQPMAKSEAAAFQTSILLAYDDLYSIEYMKQKLRPYWRRNGWDAHDLLEAAFQEQDKLVERCEAFDQELMHDLTQSGGGQYAEIAALAFRQCFAAGKFVADANGQPLQFSKENHSNGCIATSDVFYPMAPQFLLFGPSLTKSFLVPFMEYAASERWRFEFAPHDLGTYPKANGQRYGGGERSAENQMPVEECGNLLLLFAALAKMEGNADFAEQYWEQLSQWANYLKDKGFDPENQLCTDDFAGHMAHNVNLSAKAICALGAFAYLCEMRGHSEEAKLFRDTATLFSKQWIASARDQDHYRLAFDQAGTWSQKYNLVWDRILGLDLFPTEVLGTEMAYYRSKQNEFGLPLDNRSDYTKLDWILWTATLTENRQDFNALVTPVHRFLNQTPDRSPMTDWYFTSTARKRGFTARPVVGGVFLKLLYDEATWTKYAGRDATRASGWANMPIPPKTHTLVATGAQTDSPARYTLSKPSEFWYAPEFDDSAWNRGKGGFGTRQTPNAPVGTQWSSDEIWLRRTVQLEELPPRLALRIWHDEDARVYVNGKLALSLGGYTTDYEPVEVQKELFQPGENVIAIHCRQTTGGQFIDFGIDAILAQ